MNTRVLRPDLSAAVDALVPIIDGDRRAAEGRGRLSAEVIECADARGLLTSRVPVEFGGLDLSLVEQFELSEALSYADGSLGWTLSFMALSAGLVGGHVHDDGARESGSKETEAHESGPQESDPHEAPAIAP